MMNASVDVSMTFSACVINIPSISLGFAVNVNKSTISIRLVIINTPPRLYSIALSLPDPLSLVIIVGRYFFVVFHNRSMLIIELRSVSSRFSTNTNGGLFLLFVDVFDSSLLRL